MKMINKKIIELIKCHNGGLKYGLGFFFIVSIFFSLVFPCGVVLGLILGIPCFLVAYAYGEDEH